MVISVLHNLCYCRWRTIIEFCQFEYYFKVYCSYTANCIAIEILVSLCSETNTISGENGLCDAVHILNLIKSLMNSLVFLKIIKLHKKLSVFISASRGTFFLLLNCNEKITIKNVQRPIHVLSF